MCTMMGLVGRAIGHFEVDSERPVGVEDHEGATPRHPASQWVGVGLAGWPECGGPVNTWLRALSRLRHWVWGGRV